MTPQLEELFDAKIDNILQCHSSIFLKEDVIVILKTLKESIDELPIQEPGQFTKQYILDTLEEALNDFEYDEFISCEPELCGSYGDSYSLEMNTSFDDCEFKRSFLIDLENYFTPTE
jgi:hypothetical protein